MTKVITKAEAGRLRATVRLCERIRERAEERGFDVDAGPGDVAYDALRCIADIEELLADDGSEP